MVPTPRITPIHTFDNGIRLYAAHLIPEQAQRYAAGPNLHEPVEEEWIAKLIAGLAGHLGVFVDIGAAVGYYCFLAHKLNPRLALHAYEPDAANRDRLRENMALNGVDSIHIHEQAIGAKHGAGLLSGDGYGGFLAPQGSRVQGHPVPVTTLDEVAAAHGGGIDLLKMDIQGGEAAALAGAESALRNRAVKNWIVGTHGPRLHALCLAQFKRFSHRILFEAVRVEHQPDGLIVAATGKR